MTAKNPTLLPLFIAALVAAVALLPGCAALTTALSDPTPEAKTAAPMPAAIQTPFTVERVRTLSATGYAVIGVQNATNAPQQRLLAIRAAKVDAYRGLAEQVYGLYLDSNTTVSDLVVTSDSFRTRVEGVISGVALTSIKPLNDETYEVTLSLDSAIVNDLRLLYLSQFASRKR